MGRAFEKRKSTIFARSDRVAKQFAKIGKDISIAVKSGGPNPDGNPSLRRILQNARVSNMPREKIEAAIKKASGQGATDYDVVVYEGYAPHGIALVIETATDNVVRTVANVRLHLRDHGGNFGSTGSVSFLFKRMGCFRIAPAGLDLEALELDLIDHGLQELGDGHSDKGEPQVIIRCAFSDFGALAAAIEARSLKVISTEFEYVAPTLIALPEDHAAEVLALVDTLELDDDVQAVFHNLV